MEAKKVVLKCNSNIFGFQLKSGSEIEINNERELNVLWIDSENKPNVSNIRLYFFQRNSEDFIKEANRINLLYDEIQRENGQLPLYEFEITNENKEERLTTTLFGMNQFLLTPNFGSATDIKVNPSRPDICYLEYLQQSASQPFKIDFIHFECENTKQLNEIFTYATRDANGQKLEVPVILQSYRKFNDDNSKELIVYDKKVIDGNAYYQFNVLPSTKLKIKIYGKTNRYDYESFNILSSLLSCQIQQGLDYVSVENIKKFIGETFHNGFYQNLLQEQLPSLFEKGYIDLKDGLYGYKFKILKVDGTVAKEFTLTQVLKHSEYHLTN